MKRNRLFNKIISLTLIIALYSSMSASAYAELDTDALPVQNESVTEEVKAEEVQVEEETAVASPVESTEANETAPINEPVTDEQVQASEEASTAGGAIEQVVTPIVEEIKEAVDGIIGDKTKTEESEEPEEDQLEAEEDKELEEEEKTECEHELSYTSNNDGTHEVTCSKCEDFEKYTESCEFDEEGICKKCGYHKLPESILTYEDDEVIVTVSGAIPEKADLKVKPIKADSEDTAAEYTKVKEKLNGETELNDNINYGFVAYDICFVSQETSEEVEPNGDVTVKLEYKQAVLPIDVSGKDKVDVSVLHFNEQTDKIDNLTGEKKADLELDNNSALTKAEIVTDSFSTFVVTWVSTNNAKVILNIKNRDIDGNELAVGNGTKDLTGFGDEQAQLVNDLVEHIANHTFIEAKYNNQVFDEIKIEAYDVGYYYRTTYYRVRILKNDVEIATLDSSDVDNKLTVDIQAYYKEDSNLSVTKKVTGVAATDTNTQYEFKLLDASGAPVANEGYSIDGTKYHTDANGIFKLKASQKAEFDALNEGNYKIIESAIISSDYNFENFVTKVYLGTDKVPKAEYAATYTGSREYEVTVTDATRPQVVFKNMLTYTYPVSKSDEQLSKFIKYNSNSDDYNLSLKYLPPDETVRTIIYGQEEDQVVTNKVVDIIMVIDVSTSMAGENIKYVKDATKAMVKVFESKPDVDAKWKILEFGTRASAGGWINTEDVYPEVSSIEIRSNIGTNYDAGLTLAQSEMAGARAGAERIVIFLTDGQPTYYLNNNGSVGGNGSSTSRTVYNESINAAKALTNCDAFYAVGMGLGYIDGINMYGITLLENLANAVPNAKTKEATNIKASEVGAKFSNLAGTISTTTTGEDEIHTVNYYASNVVITDYLSEYVDIKPNSEFYLSIMDGDAELQDIGKGKWDGLDGHIDANGAMINAATYEVYDGDKTIIVTATYDSAERKMVISFPDGYELDKRYSYGVTFKVVPSDLAYDTYLESGYNAIGDEGTDNVTAQTPTSSGKEGFRSNTKATADYTYKSNHYEKLFPHPVIQVYYKNVWEIYKTDGDGKAGVRLDGAQFLLKEAGDNSQSAYLGVSKGNEEGKITWDLKEDKAVPVEKTYMLTEVSAPTGYAKSGEYWEIALDADNKPTVTAYTPQGETTECESEVVRNKNVITYKFYYKNLLQAIELPNTGGTGTDNTNAIGFTFIMLSTYLFYKNKKKQKMA